MPTEETKEVIEGLVNGLIEIIWPALDAGVGKSSIECSFYNVLDSWEPLREVHAGEEPYYVYCKNYCEDTHPSWIVIGRSDSSGFTLGLSQPPGSINCPLCGCEAIGFIGTTEECKGD